MDKIFSARIEEDVLGELNRLSLQLGITKKRFLEEAIRRHARELRAGGQADVWSETLGAWKRTETPGTTVRAVRRAFRESLDRHRRAGHARLR